MDVPSIREPIYAEVELSAPLPDVFESLRHLPEPVFLDSSLIHPHLGRYSYIAADPFLVLTCKGARVDVQTRAVYPPGFSRTVGLPSDASRDPFAALRHILHRYQVSRLPGLPPFQGGAVGYFAYDLGRRLEVLPENAVDDLGLPDLHLGFYTWVIAHDHLQDRTWLIVDPLDGDRQASRVLLEDLSRGISAVKPSEASQPRRSAGARFGPTPRFYLSRQDYLSTISAAKSYIAEGDIYQVCLSHRLQVSLPTHPWTLYRHLREVSPVPYGAYLGFHDVTIASVSPEMFLRLDGGRVESRPIKGTRARGTTPELDAKLTDDLRGCQKDQAENLMIVDLLRNDLGRVCEVGSVRVPRLFDLETYSTVHHLVSTIQGRLRADLDAVDLLRGCFPGGSVTGCPKIRAMEVIDELEPTRRGPYCGAIGFLGFDGDMDTSIAIRTAVVKGSQVYYQVGGAIVADSDPAAEYQETLDKAKAFLRALDLSSGSADPYGEDGRLGRLRG